MRTMLPPGTNLIVYGISLVLFIIFLPQGIVGGMEQLLARRRQVAAEPSRIEGLIEPVEAVGLAEPSEGGQASHG